MNLKLVSVQQPSKAFPDRVAVVNAETGEEVNWVSSVEVVCDVSTEFRPVATIRVNVETDLDVTAIIEATRIIQ